MVPTLSVSIFEDDIEHKNVSYGSDAWVYWLYTRIVL